MVIILAQSNFGYRSHCVAFLDFSDWSVDSTLSPRFSFYFPRACFCPLHLDIFPLYFPTGNEFLVYHMKCHNCKATHPTSLRNLGFSITLLFIRQDIRVGLSRTENIISFLCLCRLHFSNQTSIIHRYYPLNIFRFNFISTFVSKLHLQPPIALFFINHPCRFALPPDRLTPFSSSFCVVGRTLQSRKSGCRHL